MTLNILVVPVYTLARAVLLILQQKQKKSAWNLLRLFFHISLLTTQKKLQEQALEIQKYEEKVHHLADQNIQIEALALFIRYFLTVSTPVPEAHQDAARAQGKARFEQFVEQLGRHLLRGRSLVRDVVEELHPQGHEFGMHMDEAATLAEAQERAS